MPVQDEEAWFDANRAYIVQKYGGQWLIIKNHSVSGAFPTQADAFNAAVKQFGPQGGFAIKEAVVTEEVKKIGVWVR